ncbi:lipopolysaccharide heptosyltransferase I [soil metagenome]
MQKPSSVLIVKLSAIGDVIHALPALDALRAQLPNARIGWLIEELSAPLLAHHPALDKVYIIPKKRWRGHILQYLNSEIIPFYRGIRADQWDATIDFQSLFKSAFLARLSGAKLRVGFAGKYAREMSWLFNNRRIEDTRADYHVALENMRLLEGLGLQMPADPPHGTMAILPEEQDAMRETLRTAGWSGEKFLALNPGAGWPNKRWPPSYFAQLGVMLSRRMNLKPMVLWAPGEEALRDEILAGLRDVGGFAAPPTRIRDLAVLTSLCSLYVGGDTGPTHLAGLLRVPVISIFGASDGTRNCPWPARGPNAAGVVMQRQDLECEPCWMRSCPLTGDAHNACLTGLKPEQIFASAEPWLATL